MMSMGEYCDELFVNRMNNDFKCDFYAQIFLFVYFVDVCVFSFMNITLTEVVFIDQRGKYHAYDNFMVPARLIKFLHVPEQVNTSIYFCFCSKKRSFDRPES